MAIGVREVRSFSHPLPLTYRSEPKGMSSLTQPDPFIPLGDLHASTNLRLINLRDIPECTSHLRLHSQVRIHTHASYLNRTSHSVVLCLSVSTNRDIPQCTFHPPPFLHTPYLTGCRRTRTRRNSEPRENSLTEESWKRV